MGEIAVAVATYNGAKYVREQLISLSQQTVRPAEVIICDDMSADGTVDVVESFARTAPFPVKVYRNEARLGYGPNFMKAAKLCSSSVVAFCDQDDIWLPRKLERVSEAFSDDKCIAVYHDLTIVDEANEVMQIVSVTPTPDEISPWTVIPGLSLAFRRSHLNYELWESSVNHKRPAEKMAHDQWICFIASSFGRMIHVSESLVRYRQHGRNTFGAFIPQHRSMLARSVQYVRFIHESFGGRTSDLRAKRQFWYDIVSGTSQAARSRIELLRRLPPDVASMHRQGIEQSVKYYDGLVKSLALRLPAYEQPDAAKRFGALVVALTRGAYEGRSAGFKELLQDAFFGALFSGVAREDVQLET